MNKAEFLTAALAAATAARDVGAPINPVIAAAQAALESNWGQSQLAREAANLSGIKAGRSWAGDVLELPTREWSETRQDWYTTVARWRKYRDWQHSFEDYGDLIGRLYPNAANNKDDPKAYLEGLLNGQFRYATDPAYFSKVWSIVEQYDLLNAVAPQRLMLVFDAAGAEVARVALPVGADVLMRASSDGSRVYVRPD